MEHPANIDRAVFITGGGEGIGRACALLCAQRGYRVAVFDTNAQTANETAERAIALGSKAALALACDVTDEPQVERAFDEAASRLGAPYGLFANAGIDIGGLIHELPLATRRKVVDTNLTGVFLSCKHGLRLMLAAGVHGGSIVCASSASGFVASPSFGAGTYSSTKGGISSLVRCLAIDYARYGIRVNAVVPGATETGLMWNNVAPHEIAGLREQICKQIPLGRLAQPEDPARAVLWLLSDDSAYVTGSQLVCDGGVLAQSSISI